jgi:hypothetical protein
MDHSPAQILAAHLIAAGLGTDPDNGGEWPCYIALLPDKPDNLLVIYDTAGTIDGRIMATGETVEHPGIQVLVRGKTHPVAWAKVRAVKEALDAINRTTVTVTGPTDTEYRVLGAHQRGTPLALGQDDNGRMTFSLNAITTLEAIA